MNKANQLIIDTLKACGCAPAIITDKNGNKLIKVNAPAAPGKHTAAKEAQQN